MSPECPVRPVFKHTPYLCTHLTYIGELVRWCRITYLKVWLPKKLGLGNNVYFGRCANVQLPPFAHFGNNVVVDHEFFIEANLGTVSDTLILGRVSIIGNHYRFNCPTKSVYWAGRYPPATVYLEGDNLIGFGATIVGNVRIGKGCIVGAGAVVTRDLLANTICVGTSAKPIKNRFQEDLEPGDFGGTYESQL